MNKNPFEVLGIAPSAIQSMSDSQIDSFVKGVARELQKIYHPDKSGGKKRAANYSIAINQAMEQLNRQDYPEAFANWKKAFLKKTPMKKKLQDAEYKAGQMRRELHDSYGSLADALEQKFIALMDCSDGEVDMKLHIHNPWVVSKTLWWKPTSSPPSAAFFFLDVDKKGFILRRDDEPVLHKKQIIGSIEGGEYLNVVSQKIRAAFTDIDQKSQLAGHMAIKTGHSSYHGPVITRDQFHLIAKHIRFETYHSGYIVTINSNIEGSFFQIEGSVKEIFSQIDAPLA